MGWRDAKEKVTSKAKVHSMLDRFQRKYGIAQRSKNLKDRLHIHESKAHSAATAWNRYGHTAKKSHAAQSLRKRYKSEHQFPSGVLSEESSSHKFPSGLVSEEHDALGNCGASMMSPTGRGAAGLGNYGASMSAADLGNHVAPMMSPTLRGQGAADLDQDAADLGA